MFFTLWLFMQMMTPPGVRLQDEGTLQGQAVTLNCVGTGVACTVSGGVGTITASSGGGGANVVEAEVDFGATGDTTATVVVSATWVGASSVIICAPTLMSTTDRADGAEDALVENLTVTPYARSAGVGFSLKAHPAQGTATGKFKIHCTGV